MYKKILDLRVKNILIDRNINRIKSVINKKNMLKNKYNIPNEIYIKQAEDHIKELVNKDFKTLVELNLDYEYAKRHILKSNNASLDLIFTVSNNPNKYRHELISKISERALTQYINVIHDEFIELETIKKIVPNKEEYLKLETRENVFKGINARSDTLKNEISLVNTIIDAKNISVQELAKRIYN